MSATYHDLRVEPEAEGARLRVSFRIRNRSGEAWRGDDGFRFGYQIFDPETNAFIEEGQAVAPPRDIAPGETGTIEVGLQLPAVRGGYRVFVSPMVAGVRWNYTRGWPFVLLDAAVEGGRAAVVRSLVTTVSRLRREARRRALAKVFVFPFMSMWRNRGMMRSLVRRDILGRYRGSFGGAFWTLLNPLLLMLTYFFVFGIVLRARFSGDPSRSGFALYFLAGMLPWLPFSEAAGRAPFVMLEHRNFVKKLVFPLETLPVNLALAGLVTQAFALVVFTVLLVASRGYVPVSVAWLPVLLVPQVLLTVGLCWFLAALGVYVRDLGQVIGFALTLWFFLTPICYPEGSLPPPALGILSKNPMFVLVRGYRAIFLESAAPSFAPMWKLWLLSAAVFFAGHAWFYKLRKNFADVI
ncbi:MAG TPA: ABC transporter permease [Bryobacteraceae bacterium]|nr:ABC transporter permease [Bryobacteraceae bacterium]